MLRVLMISRHKVSQSELEFLRKYLGSFQLTYYHQKVYHLSDIIDYVRQFDIVIPILPLSIIYRMFLALPEIEIWIPVAKRCPPDEAEWSIGGRYFKFSHFLKLTEFLIKGINLTTGEEEVYIPEW